MKAFVVEQWGESPTLTSFPTRDPRENEVSLAIEACALNFADLLMLENKYQESPELPFVPGMELSGRILTCGAGVSIAPGTRVAVFAGSGGLAQQGCFPADRLVPIPDAMPHTEAAAFIIAYGTSHVALTHRANLQPGETLLVLGAAGGVGLTAVEIGKKLGARVIAVARGQEKLAVAKKAGADHLIDSDTADLKAELKALGGADVVYDPVGGPGFEAAFRTARPEARIVVIGFASGGVPTIKANHLLVKNLDVFGFYWGGYMKFRPKVIQDSLSTLFSWYEQGQLKPHISHTYPLERADEALKMMRSRKATGKIVVTM